MAPLNPTVNPTNDPNFRSYSDAIKVPDTIKPQGVQQNQIMPRGQEIGDRSAEYEGKGAAYGMAAEGSQMQAYGDLFKNIAQMGEFVGKAGVAVTKKSIEDQVYQIADRERQSYTETLEKIKASGGVNNILNPSSDDSKALPDEVEGLGDTLSALKTSKDNGKISQSYYQGRLLSEAKRLRAQYPGFKNEVDEAFAKVTGSNPANAYVRALSTDINRAASSVNSEVKKAESFVMQRAGIGDGKNYPNAGQMIEAVRTGRAGLKEVMDWAAPYEQEDLTLTRRSKIFNDEKASREQKVAEVGPLVDYAGAVAVNRIADAMAGKMGVHTAENAGKLETAIKAGVVPQQQWTEWGNEIARQKTAVALALQKDAIASGAVRILGQSEINKRIDASLKPLDDLTGMIYAKEIGGYHRLSQDLKTINDVTKKGLLEHPKLGPFLRVNEAVKDIAGETNVKMLTAELLKGDFTNDMKTYFKHFRDNFATQYNMRTSGVPVTFSDAIDDIKKKDIKDVRFNNALLNEVKKIHNPDFAKELRLNYAAAAFSPENRGMIGKLSADTVDSQGRQVRGQSAVFQMFTSKAMTDEMWKLGQENPQVWKNYVDWAQETLSNELINKEINTLAEIRNPAIRVGWDSDNKRFVHRYDETKSAAQMANERAGAPMRPRAEQDPEYANVERIVNRINGNLYTYKNIAESAGINPEDFILKTIANSNPAALQRTDSIPYNILRDIGLAKTKGLGSK